MPIGLLDINCILGFHTHTRAEMRCVHVKCLANSLTLVYNFYSLDYNSFELAEDYGWKDRLFCVSISVL